MVINRNTIEVILLGSISIGSNREVIIFYVKGIEMVLTKADREKLRVDNITDSYKLFKAVWRDILRFNRDSEIDDLQGLYDLFVSEKVNNPRSVFYIYG